MVIHDDNASSIEAKNRSAGRGADPDLTTRGVGVPDRDEERGAPVGDTEHSDVRAGQERLAFGKTSRWSVTSTPRRVSITATLRDALEDTAFTAEFEQGTRLSTDQVVQTFA